MAETQLSDVTNEAADVAVDVDPQASSTPRTRRQSINVALFVLLAVCACGVGFLARANFAFSNPDIYAWDETYYLSIANAGAYGLGLYPPLQGYSQMPIMGGVGHLAWFYPLAVRLFGPSILSLRIIAFAFSIVSVIPIFFTVKRIWGSAPALVAIAILPFTVLFRLSMTARMDAITFAYVAFALWLFVYAQDHRTNLRLQLATGLFFGLGLQAHIDTVITATACGFIYLVQYVTLARREHFLVRLKTPLTFFVVGYLLGFAVFLAFNVLPDPDAFFRTTGNSRVLLTSEYTGASPALEQESLVTSTVQTFFDPMLLLQKEVARYTILFATMMPAEILLLAASILGLLTRRTRFDFQVFALLAVSVLVGAVIMNTDLALYLIHFYPLLFIAYPPLFTHGFTGKQPVSVWNVKPLTLVLLAALLIALSQPVISDLNRPYTPVDASETMDYVYQVAFPDDWIAASGGLYVSHFYEYPKFVSTREIERKLGSLFLGLYGDELAYWREKAPDFVIGNNLPDALQQYILETSMVSVMPGVWAKPPRTTQVLITFMNSVQLRDLDVRSTTVDACDSVPLRAWWRISAPVSQSLIFRFQLVNWDGVIRAENVGSLDFSGRATGQSLLHLRSLDLPCDLETGAYQLNVEMTDSAGNALPFTSASGAQTELPRLYINAAR